MRKLEVFHADMTALDEGLKKMSMFYFRLIIFTFFWES